MKTYYRLVIAAILALTAWPALGCEPPDEKQLQLFANNCIQCHVNSATGAPLSGVGKDWQQVISQDAAAILKNVIEGLRGIPPLGYCSACSEQDFKVLINFMAAKSVFKECSL